MGLLDAFKKRKPAANLEQLQKEFDAFSMEGKISAPSGAPAEGIPPAPLPEDIRSDPTAPVADVSPALPELEAQPDVEPEQLGEPAPVEEGSVQEEPSTEEQPPSPADDLPDLTQQEDELEEPELIPLPKKHKKDVEKAKKKAPVNDKDFAKRLEKLQKKVEVKVDQANDEVIEELVKQNNALKKKLDALTQRVDDLPLKDLSVRISDVATEKNLINDKVVLIAKKVEDMGNKVEESVPSKRQMDVMKESHETMRQQMTALNDSVDSFKNTLYMLNKKVDLIDHTKRVEQIEAKIKEVIVYLNKVTRIITK